MNSEIDPIDDGGKEGEEADKVNAVQVSQPGRDCGLTPVDQVNSLDVQIEQCLKRLGISSAVDWDVLAFVCRHQASLASAEQIARLLGYPSTTVGDALEHLEFLKLIQRSRASQGVRLYQFISSAADPPSDSSFRQLIALAENSVVRSLLLRKLRQQRTVLTLAKKKDQNG